MEAGPDEPSPWRFLRIPFFLHSIDWSSLAWKEHGGNEQPTCVVECLGMGIGMDGPRPLVVAGERAYLRYTCIISCQRPKNTLKLIICTLLLPTLPTLPTLQGCLCLDRSLCRAGAGLFQVDRAAWTLV